MKGKSIIKPKKVKRWKGIFSGKNISRIALLSLAVFSTSCFTRRLNGTDVPIPPQGDDDETVIIRTQGEVPPIEDIEEIEDGQTEETQ